MTRKRPRTTIDVPNTVAALMAELPKPGSYWSQEARSKWLTAMSCVLQLYYPVEVERAVERALEPEA